MPEQDVHLKVTRTRDRCSARHMLIGPPCSARLLRVSLSMDAKNELVRQGKPLLEDVTVCLNPASGCAFVNMARLESILLLLR